MRRVQSAVSGGFDAIRGREILDAVQGLIRSQEHYSQEHADRQSWSIAPIPDLKDASGHFTYLNRIFHLLPIPESSAT